MTRIFATFDNGEHALKAGGALLDHGIEEKNFDLIAGPKLTAKLDGVTITTEADALKGAKQGGFAGLAVGAMASLISVFIPGFGFVFGSGALATALGAAIGTGAAGVVAGGVTGYLKDMGVEEPVARDFEKTIRDDGAMISVLVPTGSAQENEVLKLLHKYRATRIESAGLVLSA